MDILMGGVGLGVGHSPSVEALGALGIQPTDTPHTDARHLVGLHSGE